MKLEDFNSYTIEYYMISKLGLKGAKLPVFAIINSYSKFANQEFFWTQSQVAEFTGLTVRSIQLALNELCKKNLIIKRTERNPNGTNKCFYRSNTELLNQILDGNQKIAKKFQCDSEKISCDSEKISHNNKDINLINNNITNNSYKEQLKNYILQVFSNSTRELVSPNTVIDIKNNKICLLLDKIGSDLVFSKNGKTDYKLLIEKQVKYWNIQKQTNYDIEIIKKGA